MQRTVLFFAHSSKIACIAKAISLLKELNLSGLFKVINAILFFISSKTVSDISLIIFQIYHLSFLKPFCLMKPTLHYE